MRMRVHLLPPAFLALAACGGGPDVGHTPSAVQAEASPAPECGPDECTDPPPNVSQPFTGGGAGVSTTSTGAESNAQTDARKKACDAAKATVQPPPCPEADRCVPVSDTTCAYANEDCTPRGTFGAQPREWSAACKLSSEPKAWKDAHCSPRTGPGGKPQYVLCTVDATATAATDCQPRPAAGGECVAPVDAEVEETP